MKFEISPLSGCNGNRVQVLDDGGGALAVSEFYRNLSEKEDERNSFSAFLAGLPFEAIFWETPPQIESTLDRPFEFVVIESSRLASVNADPVPFLEHFSGPDTVSNFHNLSGDAHLVALSTSSSGAVYPHLLSFVRSAPHRVIDSFWRRVSSVFQEELGGRPVWVSTAGMGVYWLHLRFDRRPKYYRYSPYKVDSG